MMMVLKKIRVLIMMVSIFLMTNIPAFAQDPSKDDVVTIYENNWFAIWVITGILVVIAFILTGMEFIIYRKDPDKRQESMGGIPWVIGGIVLIALTLQIVTRLQW